MPHSSPFSAAAGVAALAFALTALSGCSSVPHTGSAGAGPPAARMQASPAPLAARISELFADSLFPPSAVSIKVVSLKDSTVLYERNAGLLCNPASNQKLFTSAAALCMLGPYYRFNTIAAVDPVTRRIYLKGDGDPLLTGFDLDSMALAVQRALPRPGPWTVVGDASRFDTLYWGNGWMWNDASDPDGMGVSALTVNANTVEVHVRAGMRPGVPPAVTLIPPTGFVKVENRANVADSVRQELSISRPLQHPSNAIVVSGDIRPGDHHSASVSVFEPDRYTTVLFRESLERAGVRCSGLLMDTMPKGLRPAAVVSRRLDSVVMFMNKVSDNLSAECLIKTLGAVSTGGPGTWDSGTEAVRLFLASVGIDTTRIAVADGSGLSRYNLTNAETILRLLTVMAARPSLFGVYNSSLPVAGEDGTLARRMRGTPAERRLRAKTGTLSGVTSLSGYAPGADGELLGFSMIMANFAGPTRPYRAVQDSIGVLLSTWRKGGVRAVE
ncbi:MAG TPA: D-alanyl-D-alanine carboxypeptidase/D-alanyl-D-alanine-endopeptidase [Bacteroidota bacterium]